MSPSSHLTKLTKVLSFINFGITPFYTGILVIAGGQSASTSASKKQQKALGDFSAEKLYSIHGCSYRENFKFILFFESGDEKQKK
ncbi:hypothetical protein SUGI_0631890 [Cryptomeria japonica]|nr:hypothetical protein SUGI_0631890 [Cryptomeria japonica]